MLTPSDIGRALVVVSLLLLVIAYVAIALRLWSRHVLRRKTFAHDRFALSALACATGIVIMWVIDVYHGGLGQHGIAYAMTGNPVEKLKIFGKIQVAMQPIWAASLTFPKPNAPQVLLVHHGRVVLWFIGDLIAAFLVCRPVAFNWDQTIPGGHCGNAEAAYIAMHTSNIVIDLSIAVLPAPTLWNLQMKTSKRIGIISMFSLGTLICAISIARLVLFEQVNLADPEFTYLSGTLYLFTSMEPLLAIILSCMPLLTPVGNIIATSAPMSWIKSITSSISSSKTTSTANSKLSSDELPLHAKNATYLKMEDGKSIRADTEINQSYELTTRYPISN